MLREPAHTTATEGDAIVFEVGVPAGLARAALGALPLELMAYPRFGRGQHALHFEFWRFASGRLLPPGMSQDELFERNGAAAGALAGSLFGAVAGASTHAVEEAARRGLAAAKAGPWISALEAAGGFWRGAWAGGMEGRHELTRIGSSLGGDLGRRFSRAASRTFGHYDELLIGVPYVTRRGAGEPHMLVLGVFCNNALAIWGAAALRCGYSKRLARIQTHGASFSVERSNGARFDAQFTESAGVPDPSQQRTLFEQPLLGVVPREHGGRTLESDASQVAISRVSRVSQVSTAPRALVGSVSISADFQPGLPPLSGSSVLNACSYRNLTLLERSATLRF